MELDVFKIVGGSFATLFQNGTVLTLAIAGVILNIIALVMLVAPAALLVTSLLPSFNIILSNPMQVLRQVLPSLIAYLWTSVLVIVVFFVIGNLLILGAVMSAAADGKNATLGSALEKSKSRFLYLFATSSVKSAVVGLGFIVFVIPGIYLSLKLMLATVAAVVGKKDVIESMQTSWSITTGNVWRILFIVLIIGIILAIVVSVFNHISRFLGTLVQIFLAYSLAVAVVLIYQNLSVPSTPTKTTRRRAKK